MNKVVEKISWWRVWKLYGAVSRLDKQLQSMQSDEYKKVLKAYRTSIILFFGWMFLFGVILVVLVSLFT